MSGDVRRWWGEWEKETKWLEGAESTMTDLRPLAGSVVVITTQKEQNEVKEGKVLHTHTHTHTRAHTHTHTLTLTHTHTHAHTLTHSHSHYRGCVRR